jgi:hypothetical protein
MSTLRIRCGRPHDVLLPLPVPRPSYTPSNIVTAIAIHANETYGDNLSPILAHLNTMPENLALLSGSCQPVDRPNARYQVQV